MKELNINLDPSSSKHLYEQIYEAIRTRIRDGSLRQGEKIPSTRALAAFLGIARSTVQTAYDQLQSEGYIETRRNSGYYVCALDTIEDFSALPELRQTGRDSGAEKGGEKHFPGVYVSDENAGAGAIGASDGGGHFNYSGYQKNLSDEQGTHGAPRKPDTTNITWKDSDSDVIDFSPRKIDLSAFPYATWKRINKDNLVDANAELFALGEPSGDRSFRETIARYLSLSRGVHCSADQVVIGAGYDYLLMLLRQVLNLNTSTAVGMEFVSYLRAVKIFRSFGCRIVPMPIDERGMSAAVLGRMDESEPAPETPECRPPAAATGNSGCKQKPPENSGVRLLYVMPAHQFPAGVTMPITRRLELLGWASAGENRYIIEDDYDSEFRYHGKPIPSLQASDRAGRVIYMGTFSKSIAPAIRVSYMILPPALAAHYHETCSFFSSTVSRIDQRLLDSFISGGYFERYLNRMRNLYRNKRDLLIHELRGADLPFRIHGEGAGLHLLLTEENFEDTASFAKIRAREETLVSAAAGKGVRVYAMTDDLIADGLPEGQAYQPTILLGYAALSEAEIIEGIKRLADAFKEGKSLESRR